MGNLAQVVWWVGGLAGIATGIFTIYSNIGNRRRIVVTVFEPDRQRISRSGGTMLIDDRDTPLVSVRIDNPSKAYTARIRHLTLQGLLETSTEWSDLPFSPERFEHCDGIPFLIEPRSSIAAHYSANDAEMMGDWITRRARVETEDGNHWYSASVHFRCPT